MRAARPVRRDRRAKPPARRARRTPEPVALRTLASDGVPIAYTLWRRPSRELVILAPGFWRRRHARENLYLATHFSRLGYDVAALDFRGHGDSGGKYGFGATEALDVEAVVNELVGPGRPYSRFIVIGLSMGGSIAAEALARYPDLPCRALVMISSPADIKALTPRPLSRDAIRQLRLRHALRMPRIAIRHLRGPKPRAAEAVERLTMPKLIVTAESDWLVDPSHGRKLAERAAPPVDHVHLELPGSLHADAMVKYVPLRLLRILDRWLARNAPP
ncbi:MAG TPA: alpha/beta fold hydrolase [Thermoanaerobaculia bacterium]|nr:alpha/beta fold hydrolase [Thermoanaerobaculia bacterium]